MGLLDIFGRADSLGQYADDARRQYTNINLPDEKWTDYDPEAYKAQSANANLVQDDPLTRAAQMSALNQMGSLAKTGLSDVDQAGYQNARDMGNQMASSGTAAALQNAQARGLSGSGQEFAMREIANQQGAGRAQQAGLQQAADSARQRAMYNQAYLSGLGNFRGQNENINAQNAGILNQFNMANTQNQNQANMYNIGNQNQAQLINTQGRNAVAQQNFGNQMGVAGAIAGTDNMAANAAAAQQAAQNAQMNNMVQTGIGLGTMAYGAYGNGAKKQVASGGGGGNYAGSDTNDFGSYA